MIKITFEVEEDFVRKLADADFISSKLKEAEGVTNFAQALSDFLCYTMLERLLNEGKTDYVVTPDVLDGTSMEYYNQEIAKVCALAAFSEYDKRKKESEGE